MSVTGFIYESSVGINIPMIVYDIFRGWLTKGFEGWGGLWQPLADRLGIPQTPYQYLYA